MIRARRSLAAFLVGVALLTACIGSTSPAPAKVYRIGWLAASTQTETAAQLEAFRAAMRDLGYVQGQNIVLEIRYADGYTDRLPALAADLVALEPDVLVAQIVAEALALKQATSVIPIVMAGVPNPVANGLIADLAAPGPNITGAARSTVDITQRRLQLLKEAAPGSSRVAFIYEPTQSQQIVVLQELRTAAPVLGIEVLAFQVRGPDDLASAFAAVILARADAMYVSGGTLARGQAARFVDFAAAHGLPAIYTGTRQFVVAGGLMFYGEDNTDAARRSTAYIAKILRGAKPAELPVESNAKFELLINMRTARALGLTIPPSVLAQATELIQ